MKQILFYLLQVILATGILYGYYHLALRNKKFHQYNRVYLLAAVFIGILIPLFSIPVHFTPENNNVLPVLQTLSVITGSGTGTAAPPVGERFIKTSSFTWENFVYWIYFLIFFIVILRIVFSLSKMRSIIRNNTVEKLDKILFVSSNEPGTPFSFFRWLFWNKKIDLQSAEGKQIFRHEIFHIRQKHSLDIVFMEILSAVFWVNPFFYLVKKELKAIHEFLADRFAIKETDPHSYAELLLMQVLDTKIRLINPFFHNQIKRRITMITSDKNTGRQYLQKVAVLPLAALVIAAFAFTYLPESRVIPGNNGVHVADTIPKPHTKKQFIFISRNKLVFETDSLIFPSKNIKTLSPDYDKIHVIVNGSTENAAILKNKTLISERITLYTKNDPTAIKLYGKNAENGVIIFEGAQVLDIAPQIFYKEDFAALDKNQKAEDIKYKVEDNKVFEKVEIEPSFPGGEAAWKKFLEKNLDVSIPVKNGCPPGTYTIWAQFIVNKDGSLADFKALTKHGYGMEDEVLKILKLSSNWIPAKQNGHIVKAYKKQPITFFVISNSQTYSSYYPAIAYLINPSEGELIKIEDLRKVNEIKLSKANSVTEAEIISFLITIDDKTVLKEFINHGSKFSEDVKNRINQITGQTFITIENILVKTDGQTKRINPKIYTVR